MTRPHARGLGCVFQPRYTDKQTRALKTSAVWWIQWTRYGTEIRESSGSPHRADAVRLLRKRLGDVAAGRPTGPDLERTTFEDVATMYLNDYRTNGKKSLDRAERSVAHLRATFGENPASDGRALTITADRILAYVAARQAERAANATINRELSALKRMLRLGQRAGAVGTVSYIGLLAERNTRTGFFEAEQWAAVRAFLPPDLMPPFGAAYITGWRVKDELLTRQRHHVDLGAGWLRLEPEETKNRDGRMFPLTPHLRALLETQLAATRALETATGQVIPWLFHRGGKPIKSFRRAWLTACGKAGLIGRIPHDFRRTAVRNLERAGVPRSAAMQMVGHKTESIYRRYAIAEEGMLREAGAKLAALHDAEPVAERVVISMRRSRNGAS